MYYFVVVVTCNNDSILLEVQKIGEEYTGEISQCQKSAITAARKKRQLFQILHNFRFVQWLMVLHENI